MPSFFGPRRVVLAMALVGTVSIPVAPAAHADPVEYVETFVATGTWTYGTCTNTGCPIHGVSTSCTEAEVVGDFVDTRCRVELDGWLNRGIVSSSACGVAVGDTTGDVVAAFFDGSDPYAGDVRYGIVAGGAAVGQALAITSLSTDLMTGALTGAYVPTCPATALAQEFVITETASVVNP